MELLSYTRLCQLLLLLALQDTISGLDTYDSRFVTSRRLSGDGSAGANNVLKMLKSICSCTRAGADTPRP